MIDTGDSDTSSIAPFAMRIGSGCTGLRRTISPSFSSTFIPTRCFPSSVTTTSWTYSFSMRFDGMRSDSTSSTSDSLVGSSARFGPSRWTPSGG